ncbi:MAG TPA: hypothetical protein VGL93_17245 [Streptosporangiaceae bacterium]|jgi:hypothetical protein
MNLQQDLRDTAQRITDARRWPDFVASAYSGFELATRTSRALVDAGSVESLARFAEAERAATDGRDTLRAAPGCMNAYGPLGAPITITATDIERTEAALSRLADALNDRFGAALDEPLDAAELVAFSQALDAADRLQRMLAQEVDDGDLP